MRRLTLLAALAAVAFRPVIAQSSPSRAADSIEIISVAQAALRGISTKDTALLRQVMLPGSQLVSATDPMPFSSRAVTRSDSTFIAGIGSMTTRYLERMWDPTLFLQGPLALVRAPYDFHIDGVFSHCGVDTFTLVRSAGAWRISHIAYTTQRVGCAPSPLGAPGVS